MELLHTSFESFLLEEGGLDISYVYKHVDHDEHSISAMYGKNLAGKINFETVELNFKYFQRNGWDDELIAEVFSDGRYVHLENIVVKHEYRRNGIASRLMNGMIDKSKELGYNCIYLCAFPMGTGKKTTEEELVKLYESYGFVVAVKGKEGTEMYKRL